MKTYITTLLTEKNIDLDNQLLSEEGHIGLTIEILIEFIYSRPRSEIAKIEMTLRKIDFLNGDIMHYINYMAKAMVKSITQ